ncbi:MAG: PEP-CTERM sorting domain-containing protein [Phycisphaerales bacterium]|nr:MAG: PEP-CTERM sorting domain-containing protein [Phycisphaerales bacterium]
MKKTIAMLAIAGLASAAIASPAKVYDTSIDAIFAPGSTAMPGLRNVNEFYGFESAEGYSVGPVAGQQGWAEFTARPGASRVSNANPASGNQHLRIVELQTGAAFNGAFSPDLGAQPAGRYITSVDIALNDDGGADYQVLGQAPSQGFLSFRVNFAFTGSIQILDDVGAGLVFVNTGATWDPSLSYTNLTVDLDFDNDTIDYFYGGNLIYSSVAGVFAGSAVEQVILLSDGFQSFSETPSPTGDFDNLSIVIPAPGAFALLGLGGLVAVRRRR